MAEAFAAAPGGLPVETVLGPSGLLRERIERGDARPDLFSPDSLEHATRLEQTGRTVAPAVVFVRNRLCLLVRPGLTVTASSMLDTLLDPGVKLGISTPRADPSGDYAWALFGRAEGLEPPGATGCPCQPPASKVSLPPNEGARRHAQALDGVHRISA